MCQVGVVKVVGTEIDCDLDREAITLPGAALTQCRLQDPVSERPDEPRPLRHRNELVGKDQPAVGVLPAHERLDTGKGASADIHLRLEMEPQLILLDRAPQLSIQRDLRRCVHVQFGRIHRRAQIRALGGVHGDVGTAHQVSGAEAIDGEAGDADAATDLELVPVDAERLVERVEQFFGDAYRCHGASLRQQQRKLITTQPRQDIRRTQDSA